MDVETLIVSGLDQLVPLPSGSGADWQDVLRRAGESPHSRWRGLFRPGARPRSRFALAVILIALVLVGAATATYVAVRTWVGETTRGPQHTSAYRLSGIVATRNLGSVESFALGPGGHDLYFVRDLQRAPQIWRVRGIDRGGRRQATRLLDARSLPGSQELIGGGGGLGVGPNGDLFLVACARPSGRERKCDLVLYVVGPDGSRQRVLAGSDLVHSKLVPPDGGWWWAPAATAANRLWIPVSPYRGGGRLRVIEVVDPNADGDWSDRVVRRLALPSSLPPGFWQLSPEPRLAGDGRARSVLAAVRTVGWRFRIYRIADRNDDGDARDPGEVRLLVDRQRAGWLVSPLVVDGVSGARRELAIARADRISVLDDFTVLRDVGRAFRGVRAILGGTRGQIYVVAGQVVYRLAPEEAEAAAGSQSALPAPSGQAVFRLPPPVASGAPRLTFEIRGADRGESYTIGADGQGLGKLVRGRHVYDVCQSVDGRAVTFASDADVPAELATYVARDGERPERLRGRYEAPICPFPAESRALSRAGAIDLLRRTARAGEPASAAVHFSSRAFSGDGTKLVAVRSSARGPSTGVRRQTLEFIDLATLWHRRLASVEGAVRLGFVGGPGGGTPVAAWSPDGTRVAYESGRLPELASYWQSTRHRIVVWVRDVATGNVALRLPLTGGGRPFLSWSPDGTHLLVCIESSGMQPACPAAAGDGAIDVPHSPARLLLVDLRDHSMRVVARGGLTFAGWAPAGGLYAYAIGGRLFVRALHGAARHVATLPKPYWRRPTPWLGWSPDGRFIALETDGAAIPVLDVSSGKLTVLRPLGRRNYENVRWWRPPPP